MKCKKARQQILLAETGEISVAPAESLEEHLGRCDGCREYRASVSAITAAAGESLPQGEPSQAVLARIRSAARERETASSILPGSVWTQALAYAAVLAVAVTAWFVAAPNDRIDRIDEMDALLAMVLEEEEGLEQAESGGVEAERLRALANRLLHMEGLSPSDDLDGEVFPDLSPAPAGEPRPTTLQRRSTPAPDPRRCV
jgi:anti-sigma factor RsiW